MRVRLGAHVVTVTPANAIGKGGEADIFVLDATRALKLFKGPDHPDLAGQPLLEEAARVRLAEHQSKLPAFPRGLPARVLAPEELACDPRSGAVLGYAMPLLRGSHPLMRYGERNFRDTTPSDARTVVGLFDALATTVQAVHRAGVVIGDFNDLNVLVAAGDPHLIDADSMQFGRFVGRAYTERFLDPRLAEASASRPTLVRPYDPAADWFAFAVMLFRSCVLVDPFGGVYRPARETERIPHAARSLHRITVFHPAVRLPRAALPLDVLPDTVLEAFRRIFEGADRSPEPLARLRDATWRRCGHCGLEYARRACPACHTAAAPPAAPPTRVVHGAITAVTVARVSGAGARFLDVQMGPRGLLWVAVERGHLRRESGARVVPPGGGGGAAGMARPLVRVAGPTTLFLAPDAISAVAPDGACHVVAADPCMAGGGGATCAGTTSGTWVWQDGGQLWRHGPLGPEPIGHVLRGQTRVWLGDQLGFGVSRAGATALAFLFHPTGRGINDQVRLPRVRGQVTEERVAVGPDRVWHLVREVHGGRLVTHLTCVGSDGAVLGSEQAEDGDGSWLAPARSLAAGGPWAFVAGDDGLVRLGVAPTRSGIDAVARYPDTAVFTADPCEVLVGQDGIYVAGVREIRRLTLG